MDVPLGSAGDVLLRLLVVVALIAINGFFVAGEFALVTARKTRIDTLAAEGSWAALAVRRAIDDPNRFISACQLGITMASLALGWVGESTIAALIEEPLHHVVPEQLAGLSAHAISVPIAFALITFLHITLGEQVPKMVALQAGEATALFTVGPTSLVGFVFRPFIMLLYWATNVTLRLLGMRWQAEHHQAYSVEDLKALLRSSQGVIAADPGSLAERSLEFSALVARQVMVPRTEMLAVPTVVRAGELRSLMRRHGHSRYPVYESTYDNVVGFISAKRAALDIEGLPDEATFDLRSVASTPLFVPESMAAPQVLAAMKQQRTHLAIVVDEYGATAGIISVRDLLDRIAGELRDEEDLEPATIQRLEDGEAIVDGLALISDVEQQLGLKLSDEDYDTVGGFVFGRIGRRAVVGDTVQADGHLLTVEELDGLRIARVRISRAGSASPTGAA
jgi:CBS domain containing-hemolysin-like protein